MAKQKLKNIFLSASIPLPDRDAKYYETADVISIRDSVIALASLVVSKHRLVWGGHPSITPLINYVLQKNNQIIQEHVHIYQSRFFEKFYPEDNNKFQNVKLIDSSNDREESLTIMRERMLSDYKFEAAIFIGGMEGVEEEYRLFKSLYPEAIILPIETTGAAAQIIFKEENNSDLKRLSSEYAYMSLFQEYLMDKI